MASSKRYVSNKAKVKASGRAFGALISKPPAPKVQMKKPNKPASSPK